jgi:hypothetical protein
MSTISHRPTGISPDTRHWSERVLVIETWASLAIFAMWAAGRNRGGLGTGLRVEQRSRHEQHDDPVGDRHRAVRHDRDLVRGEVRPRGTETGTVD